MNKHKVLLVQVPPWGVTTFPLGISYLGEALVARDIESVLYDLNIVLYNQASETVKEKWSTNAFDFWAGGDVTRENIFSFSAVIEALRSFHADIYAFSTTFASIPFCNRLIEELRACEPGCTIIVGGAGVSYETHRHFFRRDLIDYFCIGEGEVLLPEIVKSIDAPVSPYIAEKCAVWKDNARDRAVCLESKEPCDLNTIVTPTFDGLDKDAYTEKDLLPILVSRGCPNACHFCCDWRLKKPYRSRSAEKVYAEILTLSERFGRTRFEFCDLLMNGDLKVLDRLCTLLIKGPTHIHWGGQVTVRADMPLRLYEKMRKAGCGSLTFGFETFSNALLSKMNKRFRSSDALSSMKAAKKAGMRVEANLLVGFPGEEDADIDATIAFLKKNRMYIDQVNSLNICSIGPGMTLWELALKFNIYKDEITDWYAWHTTDLSNTLKIREARHARIKAFIEEEKLGLSWQNLKGGA
jgi:radical SAM superfamily enzyme YgiQ (UPF0313 family)